MNKRVHTSIPTLTSGQGTPLLEALHEYPTFSQLVTAWKRQQPGETGGLELGGCWGGALAALLAGVRKRVGHPFLVLTPEPEAAEDLVSDLSVFGAGAVLFPPQEQLGRGGAPVDSATAAERLNVLWSLLDTPLPTMPLVVACCVAVVQPVPSPERMRKSALALRVGESMPRERLGQLLSDRGFERVAEVQLPGEYAMRGGIVDIHPVSSPGPFRIELDDEGIASLRLMEPETQESREEVGQLVVPLLPPGRPARAVPDAASPLDYCSRSMDVVLVDPVEGKQRLDQYEAACQGEFEDSLFAYLQKRLRGRKRVSVTSLPVPTGAGRFNLRTLSTDRFGGGLGGVFGELGDLLGECRRVSVFCRSDAEADRLRTLLAEGSVEGVERLALVHGELSRGFHWRFLGEAFVPNHELFHRYRQRRGRGQKVLGVDLDTFLDLKPNELVVHLQHGIGRFRGLKRLEREGRRGDFLQLEFAQGTQLYVPASRIDLVQRYVGAGERVPALSALSGKSWEKRKAAVQLALEKVAQELLEVQALREQELGYAFPEQSPWQEEFEASFPYEETEDQLEATRELRQDMESSRAMDRLLCGDVGYGKTELAIRASFKCVMQGKQVAVLVPTTVLAQQHHQTFRDRMADYPIVVEVLSRLRSPAEQKEILARCARGEVDVLIGTHRLLQKDVGFRELGLVVVDEEQRFGVQHKERLKRLRATVDVLTLTATPIPRTLHMALLGLRDITCLSLPPRDRRAVRTEVCLFDETKIRMAILRELSRGGQVFFVHNRVYNIHEVAEFVRGLAPQARVEFAHGQLNESELEERMRDFFERRIDVLVTTTIIQSGLDVPSANTLIVNDANQFGLADLHQLRGRVGRYHHQAYAYFMVSAERRVTPEAQKRLRTIEEFSELGAGFKIALRDMEIRGVGNLLGREQHGHICAIGYELYCKLLAKAVRKAQNKPLPVEPDCSLDLRLEAFLPEAYIPNEKTRLEFYRRIARVSEERELRECEAAMVDRFGPLPAPVRRCLAAARIALAARAFGLRALSRGDELIVCRFLSRARVEPLRQRGRFRLVDSDTAHYFPASSPGEPEALLEELLAFFAS